MCAREIIAEQSGCHNPQHKNIARESIAKQSGSITRDIKISRREIIAEQSGCRNPQHKNIAP